LYLIVDRSRTESQPNSKEPGDEITGEATGAAAEEARTELYRIRDRKPPRLVVGDEWLVVFASCARATVKTTEAVKPR